MRALRYVRIAIDVPAHVSIEERKLCRTLARSTYVHDHRFVGALLDTRTEHGRLASDHLREPSDIVVVCPTHPQMADPPRHQRQFAENAPPRRSSADT